MVFRIGKQTIQDKNDLKDLRDRSVKILTNDQLNQIEK